MNYFAHAEEFHTQQTSTVEHLLTQWYVAIPLAILIGIALVLLLTRVFNKGRSFVIPALLAYALAAGVFGFVFAPLLGALAISAGFLLALMLVLGSESA